MTEHKEDDDAAEEARRTIKYAYKVAKLEQVPLTAVHMEIEPECGYDSHL